MIKMVVFMCLCKKVSCWDKRQGNVIMSRLHDTDREFQLRKYAKYRFDVQDFSLMG